MGTWFSGAHGNRYHIRNLLSAVVTSNAKATDEKHLIAAALDRLGVDYIEGGWPGANPTDSDFFNAAPKTGATMTAFGMTKRSGRSAGNDDVLAAVLNAGTPAVCLVGKTHDFHVTTALGIPLEENSCF